MSNNAPLSKLATFSTQANMNRTSEL